MRAPFLAVIAALVPALAHADTYTETVGGTGTSTYLEDTWYANFFQVTYAATITEIQIYTLEGSGTNTLTVYLWERSGASSTWNKVASDSVTVSGTSGHWETTGALSWTLKAGSSYGIGVHTQSDETKIFYTSAGTSTDPTWGVILGNDSDSVASYSLPTTITSSPTSGTAKLYTTITATIGDSDGDGYDAAQDCDDADAATSPGAAEVWYDGLDANCDGENDYDADSDGRESDAYGGIDCDDSNPYVKPGEDEIWYDGVDQDCDGASDYDQDGDDQDIVPEGTDCDDENPTIRAGVEETWYDGVDQDCDGASDYDADADGHEVARFGGDDCEDEDPSIYGGAPEVWYDGVDQDCDGESDYDQDGDGHDADGEGGDDCDDENPDVWEEGDPECEPEPEGGEGDGGEGDGGEGGGDGGDGGNNAGNGGPRPGADEEEGDEKSGCAAVPAFGGPAAWLALALALARRRRR